MPSTSVKPGRIGKFSNLASDDNILSKVEITRLHDELSKKDIKNSKLVEEIIDIRVKLATTERDLKLKSTTLEKTNTEKQKLSQLYEECRDNCKKQKIQLDRLCNIEHIVATSEQTQQHNETLRNQNTVLMEQNQLLTEKYDKLFQEYTVLQEAHNIQAKYDNDSQNLMTIYYDYGKCQIENHFHKERIEQLQKDLETLHNTYETLKLQYNELEIQNTKLVHENETWQSSYITNITQQHQLEITEKLHIIDKKDERIQQMIEEMNTIYMKLHTYEHSKQSIEKSMKEQMEKFLEKEREWEQQWSTLQAERDTHLTSLKEMTQLKEDNNHIKIEYTHVLQARDDVLHEFKTYQNNSSNFIQVLQCNINELEVKVNDLLRQLEVKNEDIDKLIHKITTVETQNNELSHQLQTYQEKMNHYDEMRAEKDEEIDLLKKSKTSISTAILDELTQEKARNEHLMKLIHILEIQLSQYSTSSTSVSSNSSTPPSSTTSSPSAERTQPNTQPTNKENNYALTNRNPIQSKTSVISSDIKKPSKIVYMNENMQEYQPSIYQEVHDIEYEHEKEKQKEEVDSDELYIRPPIGSSKIYTNMDKPISSYVHVPTSTTTTMKNRDQPTGIILADRSSQQIYSGSSNNNDSAVLWNVEAIEAFNDNIMKNLLHTTTTANKTAINANTTTALSSMMNNTSTTTTDNNNNHNKYDHSSTIELSTDNNEVDDDDDISSLLHSRPSIHATTSPSYKHTYAHYASYDDTQYLYDTIYENTMNTIHSDDNSDNNNQHLTKNTMDNNVMRYNTTKESDMVSTKVIESLESIHNSNSNSNSNSSSKNNHQFTHNAFQYFKTLDKQKYNMTHSHDTTTATTHTRLSAPTLRETMLTSKASILKDRKNMKSVTIDDTNHYKYVYNNHPNMKADRYNDTSNNNNTTNIQHDDDDDNDDDSYDIESCTGTPKHKLLTSAFSFDHIDLPDTSSAAAAAADTIGMKPVAVGINAASVGHGITLQDMASTTTYLPPPPPHTNMQFNMTNTTTPAISTSHSMISIYDHSDTYSNTTSTTTNHPQYTDMSPSIVHSHMNSPTDSDQDSYGIDLFECANLPLSAWIDPTLPPVGIQSTITTVNINAINSLNSYDDSNSSSNSSSNNHDHSHMKVDSKQILPLNTRYVSETVETEILRQLTDIIPLPIQLSSYVQPIVTPSIKSTTQQQSTLLHQNIPSSFVKTISPTDSTFTTPSNLTIGTTSLSQHRDDSIRTTQTVPDRDQFDTNISISAPLLSNVQDQDSNNDRHANIDVPTSTDPLVASSSTITAISTQPIIATVSIIKENNSKSSASSSCSSSSSSSGNSGGNNNNGDSISSNKNKTKNPFMKGKKDTSSVVDNLKKLRDNLIRIEESIPDPGSSTCTPHTHLSAESTLHSETIDTSQSYSQSFTSVTTSSVHPSQLSPVTSEHEEN